MASPEQYFQLGTEGFGVVGLNAEARQTGIIERQNLEAQLNAFNLNYQQQERLLGYQQNLQQQIFDREDSSVQRRVRDLQAAGLSPVLAAGQGARAGAAIPVKAPEMKPAQRGTQSNIMKAAAWQRAADVGRSVAEIALIEAQKNKINAESGAIRTLTPQKEALNAQAIAKAVNENEELKKTLEARINRTINEARSSAHSAYIKQIEASAAGLDSRYINAAKEYLKGKQVTELNNPYLLNIAAKAVAVELAKSRTSLSKAEEAIFGEDAFIGGGGASMQLLKILSQMLK